MNIQLKTIRAADSHRAATVIAPSQPRPTMRWRLCGGALVRDWQTAQQPATNQLFEHRETAPLAA